MMRRSQWLGLLVFLVTAAVMGRIVTDEFTWYDDAETIHQNPRIKQVTWRGIAHEWTHADQGIYIPLTRTVWMGLALLGRVRPGEFEINVNPWVFHGASVLAHALAAGWLYLLLASLFGVRYGAWAGAWEVVRSL